jgi:U3 small nucleolar RNA-associated protein 13
MAQRVQSKTTFAPAKVIQPIYTRGSVALSQDGRILATCLDEDVLLTDLRTGEELARIEGVSLARLTIICTRSDMLTS